METNSLLKKYNVAAPRYTSYPTVPYWDVDSFKPQQWLNALKQSFQSNQHQGISLYIHLPFCESLCTYCGCNTRITKNHGVEKPYIDALLAEWKLYSEALGERPKIAELHLGGGTPTFFSPQNLKRLLLGIIGENPQHISCSFEGHPDNTTIEHLDTLYNLGFKRISLGIQDFDPKVQFMINRFQTPAQVSNITIDARRIGYNSINFDLIYGLPGQTLEGLSETIGNVIVMRPDRLAFYSYAHVPWMKPGQRHYAEKDIPQGDEKFALYQMGRSMLLAAGYQEIGMDHFALPTDHLYQASQNHQLHRNFMGYTDRHTNILIGLGVSAISDCQTAFAQNAKTVEDYVEQINNRQLAVTKGHLLTERDLYIRQHILNLMCKGKTRFTKTIPTLIQQRLYPFSKDQLLRLTANEVEVLPAGRPFLRNICMAFDERLWQRQPNTTLFSTAV